MSLRDTAEQDLKTILSDQITGFNHPMTVTDPDGNSGTGPVIGTSSDIAQVIDPETGQTVSGRSVTVALPVSAFLDVGLAIPQGITDTTKKPWLVEYLDKGTQYKFKISQSNPDRTLGLVKLLLETYQ